ncbi:hypothetical protein [Pontibacillus yanchengensis]|uniref:Uncharacterized protein n=1 Tax=Pontibacillus yanchengensis Y32 TaxID=1385514 RepID=A0A0A2TYD0_9BACI|nr:hypothetical protein [Pontibacillus yanchengensis]KGP74255.1 hypothetical protein N782_09280 [Pontibacillus yanchengensis Y32]
MITSIGIPGLILALLILAVFIGLGILIIKRVTQRSKNPTDDLNAEITNLKKRVYELENDNN